MPPLNDILPVMGNTASSWGTGAVPSSVTASGPPLVPYAPSIQV